MTSPNLQPLKSNFFKYPTYNNMVDKMEQFMRDEKNPSYFKGEVMKWWGEFSQNNYIRLSVVWRIIETRAIATYRHSLKEEYGYYPFNFGDKEKEKIKEQFRLIKEDGGKTAVWANFYIITNFCPPIKVGDGDEWGCRINRWNNEIKYVLDCKEFNFNKDDACGCCG